MLRPLPFQPLRHPPNGRVSSDHPRFLLSDRQCAMVYRHLRRKVRSLIDCSTNTCNNICAGHSEAYATADSNTDDLLRILAIRNTKRASTDYREGSECFNENILKTWLNLLIALRLSQDDRPMASSSSLRRATPRATSVPSLGARLDEYLDINRWSDGDIVYLRDLYVRSATRDDFVDAFRRSFEGAMSIAQAMWIWNLVDPDVVYDGAVTRTRDVGV